MRKGLLVVVSGFSGAGKGTIIKAMQENDPNFKLSISATTRAPRTGEVDGQSYFFLSKEEFEDMIEKDGFIEYTTYVNNYYGTPKGYVYEQMEKGHDVFLEIEMKGAVSVRKKYPEAVMIFITAPSVNELYQRLCGRDTETKEQIAARLEQAKRESTQVKYYDYMITNDNVDRAVEEINSILTAERLKVIRREEEMKQLQKEFSELC